MKACLSYRQTLPKFFVVQVPGIFRKEEKYKKRLPSCWNITPLCWQECWDEVQRANMTKERVLAGGVDSRSKRGHTLDVVKPEGWTGPQLLPILRKHGYEDPEESSGT